MGAVPVIPGPTKITYEKVKASHNEVPKRICLKSCHKTALRKAPFLDNIGGLYIPFNNTIGPIFEKFSNLRILLANSGRFWCPIKNEEEYAEAMRFKAQFEDVVFLRDTLDMSVALSEHMIDDGIRTEIGELEYQAKSKKSKRATNKLIELCSDFISKTPYYQDVEYICAVPASINGETNLPMKIANGVAALIDIKSICDEVAWKKDKVGLKEMSFKEKWPVLENTGISIKGDYKKKNIILVDDLYQSGTTMQFVAMKLKEAGFGKIYGLSIVKSRRDTDNT